MTAEIATSKQATIYGSACAEKAEREKIRRGQDEFVMWDDLDMDLIGLKEDAVAIKPVQGKARIFKCWIEDWEAGIIKKTGPFEWGRTL